MIIQVVQDTVCPWCRIGKHNLDVALKEWDGEPVEVQWLPFLLDPDVDEDAKEGYKQRLMERKGMSPEQIQAMFDRVTQVGKELGLDFHFERIKVAVDSLPSHQLMALTPADDRSRVLDQIHIAYFERGEDIGEIDTLAGIARHAGIAPATVAEVQERLTQGFLRDEVLATVDAVQQAGVTSVPFFIINSEVALAGAQPPEAILAALKKASEAAATVPSGRG